MAKRDYYEILSVDRKADAGTIRREFAESLEANSVHGSDSIENAKIEIQFFFSHDEIVG